MLGASKSIKYSLNLNNLSNVVFSDYPKFEKQMRRDPEFRKKTELDFKTYGHLMNNLEDENDLANLDELNESSIKLKK